MDDMDGRKIIKAFLFPHIAVAVLLLPCAGAFLAYSMMFLEEAAPLRIASYVLSAYTLAVWCVKTPKIVRGIKRFKRENKYSRLWYENPRLRVNITLGGGAFVNTVYAAFQLIVGVYTGSFWFCSLAGYYFLLAVMRTFLLCYTRKCEPGENMRKELVRYRACGYIILVLNLALSVMIFCMIYQNQTARYSEIAMIAMAVYAFAMLSMAIVNVVRFRKYDSPVFSASKAISLASACVSMLTMESAMLLTFGGEMSAMTRRIYLGTSGGAVSVFIIVMALYMIVQSGKRIKTLGTEE